MGKGTRGDHHETNAHLAGGGIFEVHARFTGESHGDGYYAFCLRSGIEGDASVRVKII